MTESTYHITARIVFRKQVSDGNYGSETAEVAMDVYQLEDEELEDGIAATLATARRMVHDELQHSPSGAVKRALEYPGLAPVSTSAEDSLEDLPY